MKLNIQLFISVVKMLQRRI